jgi:hypothetical protein
MDEVVTVTLPTPPYWKSDRGFRGTDFGYGFLPDVRESSSATAPRMWVDDEQVSVREVESYALGLLWLVKTHYQGHGLYNEVSTESTA